MGAQDDTITWRVPILHILSRTDAIEKLSQRHVFTDVISINDVGIDPPPGVTSIPHHLCLHFDDVYTDEDAEMGFTLPQSNQIEQIIDFAHHLMGLQVMIHCFKGNSRSTAAALIVLSLHLQDERMAALLVRQIRPTAHPNRRMISLADTLLGRNGKLLGAAQILWNQQVEFARSEWIIPNLA